MAGPTADEIVAARDQGNAQGASSSRWLSFDLFDLIPFLALLGGIGLLATGSWLFGSLVIIATVFFFLGDILFW